MTKAITKPSFEEVITIKTMNLSDVGLRFNPQRVGPMRFNRLRYADYGKGFRMPTMPELVPLIYASLENQNYVSTKNVIKILRDSWITGNTAVHYFPQGMFAEDNPTIKNGRIVTPTQKELENRLGSHEEKRVVSSDDESVRFTPYGFERERQSVSELSKNSGVITLVGGERNAEKLAKASDHYRTKPYFWVLRRENFSSKNFPMTRVADLSSDVSCGGLDIGAENDEDLDFRSSFGVQKT